LAGGFGNASVSKGLRSDVRVAFGRLFSAFGRRGRSRARNARPLARRAKTSKPLKHASLSTLSRLLARCRKMCAGVRATSPSHPRAGSNIDPAIHIRDRVDIARTSRSLASPRVVLRASRSSRRKMFVLRTRTWTSRGCRRGTRASCGRFGAPAGPRSARGGRRCGIGGTVGSKRGMRVSDRTGMRRNRVTGTREK
jgi:hypothetical protein